MCCACVLLGKCEPDRRRILRQAQGAVFKERASRHRAPVTFALVTEADKFFSFLCCGSLMGDSNSSQIYRPQYDGLKLSSHANSARSIDFNQPWTGQPDPIRMIWLILIKLWWPGWSDNQLRTEGHSPTSIPGFHSLSSPDSHSKTKSDHEPRQPGASASLTHLPFSDFRRRCPSRSRLASGSPDVSTARREIPIPMRVGQT